MKNNSNFFTCLFHISRTPSQTVHIKQISETRKNQDLQKCALKPVVLICKLTYIPLNKKQESLFLFGQWLDPSLKQLNGSKFAHQRPRAPLLATPFAFGRVQGGSELPLQTIAKGQSRSRHADHIAKLDEQNIEGEPEIHEQHYARKCVENVVCLRNRGFNPGWQQLKNGRVQSPHLDVFIVFMFHTLFTIRIFTSTIIHHFGLVPTLLARHQKSNSFWS